MRGILLISHGFLAKEMKGSLNMICGDVSNVFTIALEPNEGIQEFSVKLKNTLHSLESYDEILVFADLYGGSPCNTALKFFIEDDKYQLISGMNVSMVLTAVLSQEEHVNSLVNIGKNAIMDVKSVYQSLAYDDEDN